VREISTNLKRWPLGRRLASQCGPIDLRIWLRGPSIIAPPLFSNFGQNPASVLLLILLVSASAGETVHIIIPITRLAYGVWQVAHVKATPAEITNKVWALSHVLRDDGIVFHKYLSELTYLLFLKIADERKSDSSLPEGCGWSQLVNYSGRSLVGHYRKMLTRLGEDSRSPVVREIFGFPTTVFSHDENLRKVVTGIAGIDWSDAKGDGFGSIYESLLERNATESRSGAGQYFTPRPLVECMVGLLKPRPGQVIQDPAAGTGGFLVSAWEYLRRSHLSAELKEKPTRFEGVEIEREARLSSCVWETFKTASSTGVILFLRRMLRRS
jgi:hypothetical protein